MEIKDPEASSQGEKSEGKTIKKWKRNLTDPHRVGISSDANTVLEALVERCNDGFAGGEITRSDVVNWLLLHSTSELSESDIRSLRGQRFDERKMLASLLANSVTSGDLPDDFKRALREHCGMAEQPRKRSSRSSSEVSTDSLWKT